ncbi:hypothetical protein OTERR_06660 [Oryzomicrobium terrae]|uniref:HD-GYP domain-containing protein n=1 Tax=Oryzomicrobium terrae TaxID=1735038 RepID=A0A5C1E5F0_9RHOO|nr:HD domain-containing phosphohydrolase [Oryzomicrobium terrae]QEL64142.1 hypothetical protein OTERR_06660 [Oryzomicrobium terrae]
MFAADALFALPPDESSFHDFADALTDLVPAVEGNVHRLRRAPDDAGEVASLFRALHNLKGDAALCRFAPGVAIAHPLETLLARVRAKEMPFDGAMAETVLLALDRLELTVEALVRGDTQTAPGNLRLPALIAGLERLAGAPPAQIPALALEVIEQVTGFRPTHLDDGDEPPAPRTPTVPAAPAGPQQDDLQFFRSLADRFEARSPRYAGRTERQRDLALDINADAGQPVPPAQLEAAVYLHDLGMMLLPDPLWLRPGSLTDTERQALMRHPEDGAGLLARMPGWQAAAEIVAQHHEMPDGRGYPHGLKNGAIAPGAKILAIVDAFEAVMLKHKDRGLARSTLRAVAEINACENQFAPEFIAPFNRVMRRRLERPGE